MKSKRYFKLGIKAYPTYRAVYGQTQEEIEKLVNNHLEDGWELNGDTIYHDIGYTQPLKKTEYK